MAKYLFIIPNLHEKITGANKRAINIAIELSKSNFVRVISNKEVLEYERYKIKKKFNSSLISILYYTMFFKYSAWFSDHITWSLIPKKGLVFTLHDMKEYTQFSRRGILKKILLKIILTKSKHLITVSNNQSQIINEVFGVSSKVVLNSISNEWLSENREDTGEVQNKYNLQNKYVVYVSNFTEHKNHLSILKQKNIINNFIVLLVGTSQDKTGDIILNRLKKITNIRILENISEKELIEIVRNSEFGIFPSNYEGFGMPILETISQGKNILVNEKLQLDHFKHNNRIKFVSFKKNISNHDIFWAQTYHKSNDNCISKNNWANSVAKIEKYLDG